MDDNVVKLAEALEKAAKEAEKKQEVSNKLAVKLCELAHNEADDPSTMVMALATALGVGLGLNLTSADVAADAVLDIIPVLKMVTKNTVSQRDKVVENKGDFANKVLKGIGIPMPGVGHA